MFVEFLDLGRLAFRRMLKLDAKNRQNYDRIRTWDQTTFFDGKRGIRRLELDLGRLLDSFPLVQLKPLLFVLLFE